MAVGTRPEVDQLRVEVKRSGGGVAGVSDENLGQLLDRLSNDVDLACSALVMIPRPVWVREVVGS